MTAEFIRKTFAILIAGLFTVALAACEDQGPAEQAGEAVDNATEEAGEALEEAGEAAEDATTN